MAIAENLTGKIHEYNIVGSSPSDFLPILYKSFIFLVSFPQKKTKPLFFTGVVPKEDPFPPSAHIQLLK